MHRMIDLDQVRVVQADDYKGNSRVYLEVLDERILYSSPGELAADEHMAHYVTEGPYRNLIVDTEGLASLFRARLGHLLATMLLSDSPALLSAWNRNADREIGYVKPRLAEEEAQ
jgi:hypothetical protein